MDHIGLFAKYWQPGQVKTRLAARLGDQVACELYEVFLFHLRDTFAAVADRRCVVFSPAEREAEFSKRFVGWDLEAQVDGDLGDRMRAFFKRAFSERAFFKRAFFKRAFSERAFIEADCQQETKVIVVGADCPQLSSAEIETAFSTLDQTDVVLGPSNDGGYYLLGMKETLVDVFSGVQWSTEKVLEQTIALLDQQGIGYHLLPPKTDIDDADSLQRVIGELKRAGGVAGSLEVAQRNSLLCKKIETLLLDRGL